MRKTNKAGVELIKSFEGCELKAYKDIVGVLTIGYGHTGSDVRLGQVITKEQAEEILKKDLEKFEAGVESACAGVKLGDNQFAALVCFSFNVGLSAFNNSTMLKLLKKNNFLAAANEFERWNKAGGQVVAGLTRRRLAEKALFLKS